MHAAWAATGIATFLATKPPHSYRDRTSLGAADRDDGAERGAVLRGRRLDIDEGNRVEVVGVIRVIDHKPAVVGTVFVPAWVDVSVMESLQ